MRKLLLFFCILVLPLMSLVAQEIVIFSFKTGKIPSGDVRIFSRFLREEVQKQIDVLNRKINAENRKIRNSSETLLEIPRYSLIKNDVRHEEERADMLQVAARLEAEYLLSGEISLVGSSYIIDSVLLRVTNGEAVRRDRRLVAGLGELTAATTQVAQALLDNGEVILREYVRLNADILAESDRTGSRDTGEVTAEKGVVFRGIFSVDNDIPEPETKVDFEKLNYYSKLFRIGGDAIYTLGNLTGAICQKLYFESDMLYDRYLLSTAPADLYEEYRDTLNTANTLFYGFFGSFWSGLTVIQATNLFGPARYYSYSGREKLFMTIGSGLDSASDIMLLFAAQFGLEARNRNFEATSGDVAYADAAGHSYDQDMLWSGILFWSGLGSKIAGLTFRILAEAKPPEGRRGGWNRTLYFTGGAASAAGTVFSWMVFKEHEEAGQAYIDYIHSPAPSDDDYERYERFYAKEYLPMVLISAGCLALGGILKGLSYYIPGPKAEESESGDEVSFDIGGRGGYLVARLSW
ncbi:MAG: hypothetical protein JW874_08445 [Spirochaetales bacterium]|nr:hypothetical protein [Spirochaetales bacterium]